MTVNDVVQAYADETSNWDFFSDPQRAYIDSENHIVVCLRNYNWYITKEPIKDVLSCVKSLFEIDWIAEYDEEDREANNVEYSKYWRKI